MVAPDAARASARQVRRPRLIPLWALLLGALVVALIGTSPQYAGADSYIVGLIGKFLCFAIFALSVDLIWGFTGILSLGQAVYFGIGAYMIALSMKLNYTLENVTRYGKNIPDFMEWNGLTEVPGFMEPLLSTPIAIACALAIPTTLAFIFGVITFKRHIYGVYCAVITLAESLILERFIVEYQAYTGGFNGITDYSNLRGAPFLWVIIAVAIACFTGARVLTHSRIGTVLKSVRDNDVRAQFMGYNVANYRIFVFCISALMSAAAGAMYAAWVGIVSFLDAGPQLSFNVVIWTAVGGRATLIGPLIGAFLINGLEFMLSSSRWLAWLAQYWQVFMGFLFIAVVLWIPDGIVGTIGNWIRRRQAGTRAQIREDADRLAHDRQRDWDPAGAAKPGEERI
jgi:urea transport system permease protein